MPYGPCAACGKPINNKSCGDRRHDRLYRRVLDQGNASHRRTRVPATVARLERRLADLQKSKQS